jgi:hypothetical protein
MDNIEKLREELKDVIKTTPQDRWEKPTPVLGGQKQYDNVPPEFDEVIKKHWRDLL